MRRFAQCFVLGLVVMAILGRAAADEQPKTTASSAEAAKEAISTDDINKLIRQLGDKDYFVRQRAQDELARCGFEAFDAINAAVDDADVEISSRAKYLLKLMRVEWTTESDSPEVKKCMRDYELDDTQARESKMQTLAALPDGQGAATLCRLTRFEKNPLLSKAAAVAFLTGQIAADKPKPALLETVHKTLRNCKRPGAVWMLAWAKFADDPNAAMTELTNLVDDERKLLIKSPKIVETSPAIITGLIRFQISQLKRLDRTEEAMAAIARLVELERGNPETLAELLAWLVEQKAWKSVDDLAGRFAGQLAGEPGLLYILADAYNRQDKKEIARQTADRAFRLKSGKQPDQVRQHLLLAHYLRGKGLFAWSRREFDHVISQSDGKENEDVRIMARSILGEMLHDQGQDLDAAAAIEPLVAELDSKKLKEDDLGVRRPNEIRSRMHYFAACHWAEKKDLAKQRESLDKAVKADPADVDVLIACYRLPQQTAEYRQNVMEKIKKSADAIRDDIADSPEDSSPYNQFAWLIGNTEGDFDEALKCSLKSIELAKQSPESKSNLGGLYDTLARVYFAKGDLDNAVKYQTKAAELDPHSGLIRRQLELFRKNQQEKKP